MKTLNVFMIATNDNKRAKNQICLLTSKLNTGNVENIESLVQNLYFTSDDKIKEGDIIQVGLDKVKQLITLKGVKPKKIK